MNSHVIGSTAVPLLDGTIGAALAQAAARWPDALALVDYAQDRRFTWAEFDDCVSRVAAGFSALGLGRGDRIGIWSLNRWEWAVSQFAAARIGVILVTLNPAYRTSELAHALADSGCAAILLSPPFKTSDYMAMLRELVPELGGEPVLRSAAFPGLRHVVALGFDGGPGTCSFAGLTGTDAGGLILPAALTPDDPINIQYTSGTTGRPKGVTLSHRNILNNGYFVGRGIGLTVEDRLCIPVPLYHCFGLVMGNLACVTSGAAMVYPGEGFDPAATLAAVAAERCTALYGVPTMFIAELDHPRFAEFDLSSLRVGIMAGAPCPIEVMRRVAARMNMHEVTICYGMTETSPVSFQSDVADPLERRVSTVGRVAPHLEVKLVDAAGEIVPRGEKGELCVRGYSVMLGYWNNPGQTATVIDADGWMHSGDLATLDEEGYCKIVGRLKDMVVRGGENLYPREIEEFLFTHPAIRDVQVFGVPDPRYGEELCAWIVTDQPNALDEAGVRAFCAGRIAHQKVPRYVRFVDGFPLTVSGKPQKYLMRATMIEALQIAEIETA